MTARSYLNRSCIYELIPTMPLPMPSLLLLPPLTDDGGCGNCGDANDDCGAERRTAESGRIRKAAEPVGAPVAPTGGNVGDEEGATPREEAHWVEPEVEAVEDSGGRGDNVRDGAVLGELTGDNRANTNGVARVVPGDANCSPIIAPAGGCGLSGGRAVCTPLVCAALTMRTDSGCGATARAPCSDCGALYSGMRTRCCCCAVEWAAASSALCSLLSLTPATPVVPDE